MAVQRDKWGSVYAKGDLAMTWLGEGRANLCVMKLAVPLTCPERHEILARNWTRPVPAQHEPVRIKGRPVLVGHVWKWGHLSTYVVTSINGETIRADRLDGNKTTDLEMYHRGVYWTFLADSLAEYREMQGGKESVGKDRDGKELFVGNVVEGTGTVVAITSGLGWKDLHGTPVTPYETGLPKLILPGSWRFLAASEQEWRASQEKKAQPLVRAPACCPPEEACQDCAAPSLESRYTAFRLAVEQAVPKGVTVVTDVIHKNTDPPFMLEARFRNNVRVWTGHESQDAVCWLVRVGESWATELGREVMGKR